MMKQYFDFLDRQFDAGRISRINTTPLMEYQFPELRGKLEAIAQILAAWRPYRTQEACISDDCAEALFLFDAFLRSLAVDLACSDREIKCPLCAYAITCDCRDVFQFCSQGITEYLTERAGAFKVQMERDCKSYFAYLDRLRETGGYDQYTAEAALKAEFPWLSGHEAYAKYVMACWMLRHNG